MSQLGRVILATQAQRVALSALDPQEVLKLAKGWAMWREFKRRGLPDTPNDLNVDHLETIARCSGLGSDPGTALVAGTNFVTPPWMSDAAVTNSWVADPRKVTFGTGNGIASLAAEKGAIALVQGGGASLEPQLATTGWGKSTAACITHNGTSQFFTGDGLAASTTGNDVPFTIIMSAEQTTVSGGGTPIFWAFANTSDANTWHWLEQGQNGGAEVYRVRRSSSAVFSNLPSTFPYPVTSSIASNGYWRLVLTMAFTGIATTLRVNGIVTSIDASSQNVASLTFSKFTVGAFRGATTSSYMPMKWRRLVFAAGAPSTNTYTPAENYMRQENQVVGSPKKGIILVPSATYSFPSAPDPQFGGFQKLGASWYSSYEPTPWGQWPLNTLGPVCETLPALTDAGSSLAPGIEFVPSLTSLAMVDSAQNRAWAQANGTNLLTINEPDAIGSTNPAVSVGSVISRWSTIRAMGMTTGAPAVSSGADQTSGWLHDFMTHASAPVVDFIPIHSYIPASSFASPATATTTILNLINGCFALYSKPVWLHEFNGLDFTTNPWGTPTQAQMIAILQRLVPWLEASSNCARYALYEMHNPMALDIGSAASIGTMGDDGAFTSTGIGASYADLGRR